MSQYFENSDVSSFLYKRFKNHKEDVCPTLSDCKVAYNSLLFPKNSKEDNGFQYVIRMRNNEMAELRERQMADEICTSTLKRDDNQWRRRRNMYIQCMLTLMKPFLLHSVVNKQMLGYNGVEYLEVECIYSPYNNLNAAVAFFTLHRVLRKVQLILNGDMDIIMEIWNTNFIIQ